MKNIIKVILLSLVVVLAINIVLFSVLTVIQAPYYDEAPVELDSIYELYASEEFNDVSYRGANNRFFENEDFTQIDNLLKSAKVRKMNKVESYFSLMSFGKDDFVLSAKSDVYDNRENAMGVIYASYVLVYVKNDKVYAVCAEFTEENYSEDYRKVVVYQSSDKELVQDLSEYRYDDNKTRQLFLPKWRHDILGFPESARGRLYVLSFFVEFIISVIVMNVLFKTKFKKVNNKNKKVHKK